MAKTVKMCDLTLDIALQVFKHLNSDDITIQKQPLSREMIIITDKEPAELTYPEGWYYAKGSFRNKHNSTTGMYSEAYMFTSHHKSWSDYAKYCTRETAIN